MSGSPEDRHTKKRMGLYHVETAGDGRSTLKKRVFSVVVLSIAAMIAVSALILYHFYHSYRDKTYAHLNILVEKHRRDIDSFLKENLGAIRFIAKIFTFDELRDASFLENCLMNLQSHFNNVFVDLGVINARGVQIAYAGPFRLGKALYTEAPWFKKAIQSEYFISDVFMGLRELPHFIIAVRENHNGHAWILRATIDFVAFNNLVESIQVGETGLAYIVNREGSLQTKTKADVMKEGEILTILGEMEKGRYGQTYITTISGRGGNKYLYVAALLKDGQWLLIYRQKISDAFREYNHALRVAIAIILLGGVCVVAMGILLTSRVTRQMEKGEREREAMSAQIVESGKLAAVGELAAGIAHEINNPVAIMVEEAGWIEDLLEEEEFRESKSLKEFHRALEQIRTQGRRCKEITHKLLSFARKTDSRIHNVKLNQIIEEVVSVTAQRAKYAKVAIEKNLQEDLPCLRLSSTEMQQVILNLINNAIDAMEPHGGRIMITTRSDQNALVVEVEDNGPGIPEANLARIFEPFFTTKAVGKGTGLGLSICYGIIKKIGGDIEVESHVGKGTTFRIKIPLPVARGSATLSATSDQTSDSDRMNRGV